MIQPYSLSSMLTQNTLNFYGYLKNSFSDGKMKGINKYMFLQEAAIRCGIPYETVKNKVKPSLEKEE